MSLLGAQRRATDEDVSVLLVTPPAWLPMFVQLGFISSPHPRPSSSSSGPVLLLSPPLPPLLLLSLQLQVRTKRELTKRHVTRPDADANNYDHNDGAAYPLQEIRSLSRLLSRSLGGTLLTLGGA